jgi:hypothetical protein
MNTALNVSETNVSIIPAAIVNTTPKRGRGRPRLDERYTTKSARARLKELGEKPYSAKYKGLGVLELVAAIDEIERRPSIQ